MTDHVTGTTDSLEAIRRAALQSRGMDPDEPQVEPTDTAVQRRFFGGVAQLATGAATVMFATGIVLAFAYRPAESEAIQREATGGGGASFSRTMSELHQWSAWATAGLVAIWLLWVATRWLRILIVAVPVAGVAAFSFVTGYRIAWDQLVITNDLVNQRLRGVWPVFQDGVVGVIVGDEQHTVNSMRWLVGMHTTLALFLLLGLVAMVVMYNRIDRAD